MADADQPKALSGSFQEFQTQLKLDKEAIEQKQLQSIAQSDKVLQRLEQQDVVRKKIVTEEHGVQVHNYFYYFLTSNPLFDSRTGKCKWLDRLFQAVRFF